MNSKAFSGLPNLFLPGGWRTLSALFQFLGMKDFQGSVGISASSLILPMPEPSIKGFLIFNSYCRHHPPGFLGLTSTQYLCDCFFFFHQGSEGPQAFWLLTMSSFPPLKWKMYFFKTWNEFFPPAKLSVPWNEFLTANLILPSNTSSEQHRADSISCWSRWSITSEHHKNHVTQVMHSHSTVTWPAEPRQLTYTFQGLFKGILLI